MTTSLSFDDVLTELWDFDVTVKDNKLVVKPGDKLTPVVKNAVMFHRDALVAYYSDPDLMQDLIMDVRKRAEFEPDQEKSADLWSRYYKILEARRLAMRKPWALVPEDEYRCPKCPSLGMPAVNGIYCHEKCHKEHSVTY